MTIITNHMRGQITNAVLRHAFADDLAAFLADEKTLIQEAYKRLYKARTRELLAELAAEEENSVSVQTGITVKVRGMQLILGNSNRSQGRGSMQSILPPHESARFFVLESHRYSAPDTSVEEGDAFGELVYEHAQRQEALNALIAKRRAEVSGILSTIRTDGQLEERWPAVLPIAAEFIKSEPKPQLPAVVTADLNDALGLPPLKDAG